MINKPRTGQIKDCKSNDGLTDSLTNWQADGRQVQYLSKYVLQCKKRTLENPGNIFHKSAKPFLEKSKIYLNNIYLAKLFLELHGVQLVMVHFTIHR